MSVDHPSGVSVARLTDRQRFAWLLVAVATLSVSFVLSSQESPHISSIGWVDYLVKKGGHFTGYAILGAVLTLTVAAWRDRVRWLDRLVGLLRGPAIVGVLLAAAWALSDEMHQSLRPDRTPLATDVLLDTFGAMVGAWLVSRVVGRRLGWWGRRDPGDASVSGGRVLTTGRDQDAR